jgi:hypothetical protein
MKNKNKLNFLEFVFYQSFVLNNLKQNLIQTLESLPNQTFKQIKNMDGCGRARGLKERECSNLNCKRGV